MIIHRLLLHCAFLMSFLGFTQTKSYKIELDYIPNSEYFYQVKKSTKLKTNNILDSRTKSYFDSLGIGKNFNINKIERYKSRMITKERHEFKHIPLIYKAFNFKGKVNGKNFSNKAPYDTITIIGYINKYNKFSVEKVFKDKERATEESSIRRLLYEEEFQEIFPKEGMKIGETIIFNSAIYYDALLDGPHAFDFELLITLNKVKKGVAYFAMELKKYSKIKINDVKEYFIISSGDMQIDIDNNYIKKLRLNSSLHLIEKVSEESKKETDFFEGIDIETTFRKIKN